MNQALFNVGSGVHRSLALALASALRRYALTTVRGTAVSAVRLRGVLPGSACVPGVHESVDEIVDGLKGLVFAGRVDQPVWLGARRATPGPIRAGDLELPPGLELAGDPNQALATVTDLAATGGGEFSLAMEVRSGVGKHLADFAVTTDPGSDLIPVDTWYSPVRRAWVRASDVTQPPRIWLGLETNGGVPAPVALREAVDQLLGDLQTQFETEPQAQAGAPVRLVSNWFPAGRATTLGHLLETTLLVVPAQGQAQDELDVSHRVERGDFLDHPEDERVCLSLGVNQGAPAAARWQDALSRLHLELRAVREQPPVPVDAKDQPLLPPWPRTPAQRRYQRLSPAQAPRDPLELQRESYRDFVGAGPTASPFGLDCLLRQAFELTLPGLGKIRLVDWCLGPAVVADSGGDHPGISWVRPLSVTLRITRPGVGTIEPRLDLADIPAMTERASFLVNGRERICIGELAAAPGLYFTMPDWRSHQPVARVVPHHGVEIRFELARDGSIRVSLGGGRRFAASLLLQALGQADVTPLAAPNPAAAAPPGPRGLSQDAARREIGQDLTPDPGADASRAFGAALRSPLGYSLGRLGRRRLNRRLGRTGSSPYLEAADVVAIARELRRVAAGEAELDDMDHMKNLVVRLPGATLCRFLQPAFQRARALLIAWLELERGTPAASLSPPPVAAIRAGLRDALESFLFHQPLARDLDTTNPLAMVAQARQVTRCGPDGLDRKHAGLLNRYVHPSHYGRLCVVDTPEGEAIGLLRALTLGAVLDADGFVLCPYRRVRAGRVTSKVVFFSPEDEETRCLAAGDAAVDASGRLVGPTVMARRGYEYVEVEPGAVDAVGAAAGELLGVPAHLIPLIEHDDPNRALMGANMSRQALAIRKPELPLVATGHERVPCPAGPHLTPDAGTGPAAVADVPLAAPGRNLLVAFACWEGYNFEDGLVISERLLREDGFTAVLPRRFSVDLDGPRAASDQLTSQPPGREPGECRRLDAQGLVRRGTWLRPGDLLVGRVRVHPDGRAEDASVVAPPGCEGLVADVTIDAATQAACGRRRVTVALILRRRLAIGDKMANRHGAKGVVSLILPEADMPHLADGTPVDLVFNPLSVPSRMNLGQLLEAHLSLAARALALQVISPPFAGATPADTRALLREAGLAEDGRQQLYDGRTGRPLDQCSTVGFVYWRRLRQMVDDSFQARSTGAYDPVSGQPVAGRKQFGGQKVGKMEIWALQSHGAAENLREFLSIKADDALGRQRFYDAIVDGRADASFLAPESATVLRQELRAAGLDVQYLSRGQSVDTDRPYTIAQVDEVRVRLASDADVREWSRGEVRSELAFDPGTGRPLGHGLFCERIFGPEAEVRCDCGAQQGDAKHGQTCSLCGGEVLGPEARLRRLGHVELAVPVLHPWLRSVEPNPLLALLDLDKAALDEVVYCRADVVTDPGETPLTRGQRLGDAARRTARQEYGRTFRTATGAEAIAALLRATDPAQARARLSQAVAQSPGWQAAEAWALLGAMQDPVGTCLRGILRTIPVLPAGLRPAVVLADGRLGTSDLNELYERVIRRSSRLRALQALQTPESMLRDEQRLLQEAVDALFGNGYRGRSLRGSRDRALTSLSDRLKGPEGRFIQNLAGKRTDYSARTVVAPGTFLRVDQCGVPKELAIEVFRPFVVGQLRRSGAAGSRPEAERLVDRVDPAACRALAEVVKDRVVLLVRAPALHKYSLLAFRPVITNERVIRLHPNVTIGFNADYDGDEMTIHVPLSAAAQQEARQRLLAPRNLFGTASGAMMNRPSQDAILGCWYMTAERPAAAGAGRSFPSRLAAKNAWKRGDLDCHAPIEIRTDTGPARTTVGRLLLDELLPPELGPVRTPMGKSQIEELFHECHRRCGTDRLAQLVDDLKEFGFHQATVAGLSIWHLDSWCGRQALLAEVDARVAELQRQVHAGALSAADCHVQTVDLWTDAWNRLRAGVMAHLSAVEDGFLPLAMMVRSGARANANQMTWLFGMHGLNPDTFGHILGFPLRGNGMDGMPQLAYFVRSIGARAGLAMTSLRTASAGDLMRRVVEALEDVVVTEPDCGTSAGLELSDVVAGGRTVQSLAERIQGRFAARDVVTPNGTVLVGAAAEITPAKAAQIVAAGVDRVAVRSPVTCETRDGICACCYGLDLGAKRRVEVGSPAGITAALSLGEPLTQLTMRSFHLGQHQYPFSKIARGKPEQDVKYQSAFPRLEEVFEMLEKKRARGPALDGVDPRLSPQEVLELDGEAAAARHIVDELTRVYGESGVLLSSKHYEIAARQMLSFVEVADGGDTGLRPGLRLRRQDLVAANSEAVRHSRRPASARPLILSVSEVALRSTSFLAASASWETVKVLTRAALREDTDRLRGMRENIILGRLVPTAGLLRPPSP